MTAKSLVCPRCMGAGSIPIGPEHLAIVEFLSKKPKEWFRSEDLPGENVGSRISALVVAGLVEARDNPHHGNKYRIDPYWYLAHQKPVDPQ